MQQELQNQGQDKYLNFFTLVFKEYRQTRLYLKQFIDGVLFYEILCEIGLFQDHNIIIYEANSFSQKLYNLKLVMIEIQKSQLYNKNSQQQLKQINLIKFIKQSDTVQFCRLSQIIIQILFNSSKYEYFIQIMLETQQKTQQFFMEILKNNKQNNKYHKQQKYDIQNNKYKYKQKTTFQKILQLQNQNQKILQILDQVIEQKQDLLQQNKTYQQEIYDKNKYIQQLQIKIQSYNQINNQQSLLQLKSYEQEQEQYQYQYQSSQLNSKIQYYQSQSHKLIKQIQNQQKINHQLKIKLQKFNLIQQQIDNIKNQKQLIMFQNQQIRSKLSNIQILCKKKTNQFYQIHKQNQSYQNKMKQYEQKLSIYKKQLQEKNLQIQNLELQLSIRNSSVEQENLLNQSLNINRSMNCQILLSISKTKNELKSSSSHNNLASKLKSQIFELKNLYKKSLQQIDLNRKSLQKLKIHEIQNIKLVDIISHMNKYRGQQNQILIKCLYKMRMKILKMEIKSKNNQIQSTNNQIQSTNNLKFNNCLKDKNTSENHIIQNVNKYNKSENYIIQNPNKFKKLQKQSLKNKNNPDFTYIQRPMQQNIKNY